MYSETLLESLIQKIYEAALGSTSWDSFLLSLSNALDSRFPSLFFVDPINHGGSLAVSVGMDEKFLREYGEYYCKRNVWVKGAVDRDLLRPGIVRSSNDMCTRREFLRSEWYAHYCRPQNIGQILGATIHQDRTTTSNICVCAGDDRPPYGEDDLALFSNLMPHLQRGLKMHMHLAASQARGHALEAVLNSLSAPVLLVTGDGRVLFMNTAAERLIRSSDGLLVEGGALRALISDDTKALRALVAPCANVTWNTCLLEFTVQGSITHGSSTGFFDEPRSIRFDPGHPGRSPEGE